MSRQRLTRAFGHMGWITGTAAFLLFGLLQGALVGGTVGLETGSYLFGYGSSAGDTMPRIMAAAGMLAGIAIAGAVFVTCGLALGRLTGILIGLRGHAAGETELPKRLHTKRN